MVATLPKPKTQMWKVNEIINGNTVKIAPKWSWAGQSGDIILISGYPLNINGMPKEAANNVGISRLNSVLMGQDIILSNPTGVNQQGHLCCDVLLNNVNIAKYFPDFTP